MASTTPNEEEVEWANHRMISVRMSQCSVHPDEDVEQDISIPQTLLAQPAWSSPTVCNVEPEYVDDVEMAKEFGVVSKGFRRVSTRDFRKEGFDYNPNVTYVPSNLESRAHHQAARAGVPGEVQKKSEDRCLWQLLQGRECRIACQRSIWRNPQMHSR